MDGINVGRKKFSWPPQKKTSVTVLKTATDPKDSEYIKCSVF